MAVWGHKTLPTPNSFAGGIGRPLKDAQAVGVKDVQRYSLDAGAVGLSDLSTEP
jgi:hypothetical protein